MPVVHVQSRAASACNKNREYAAATEAGGILFHPFGLLLLAIGMLAAVWFDQTGLAALPAVLLVVALLSFIWARCSFWRLHVQADALALRLFCDESASFSITLHNRKLLPVVDLRGHWQLPPGLTAATEDVLHCALLPGGAALSWRCGFRAERRGVYRLPPVELSASDLFGFYRRRQPCTPPAELLVYPRLYPVNLLPALRRQPVGDSRSHWSLAVDPCRPFGIRPFVAGDSLRHVHWKATARQRHMQVKVFEPTVSAELAVFVAAESFTGAPEAFELALSTAGSLARQALAADIPVGLYLTGADGRNKAPVLLPPGARRHQLLAILEALAAATRRPVLPLAALLEPAERHLSGRATLLVLLHRFDTALLERLMVLAHRRHHLMLLQIGTPDPAWPELALPVCPIRTATDLRWAGWEKVA